jgi:methionyl aminopeptidase
MQKPDYATDPKGYPYSEMTLRGSTKIETLNAEQIEKMKVVCRLGREVLEEGAKMIKVGTTTDEIDRVVHDACMERNCYPSPLNYYQFPKSCCTSVNEVICHGIPDQYELRDGDICNIDVSVYHDGFHSDLNETYCVGNVD